MGWGAGAGVGVEGWGGGWKGTFISLLISEMIFIFMVL